MSTSRTEAALQALMSGTDIDMAVEAVDTAPQSETTEEPSIQPEQDEVESQETPNPESDSDEASSPESSESEEVVINGRRVKIDYSDKEQIKKYAKMAGGMRKFQAERDQLKTKLETIQPEYEELKNTWGSIESAFAKEGIEGVVRVIAGDEAAFQKWEEDRYNRRRAKEDASPAELERIELEEKLAFERKQRERIENETKAEREKREAEGERQEVQKYQNLMTPAFNKWRFTGKLGDSKLEADIDSMVWEKARVALGELDESIDLTPRVVEREFKRAANSFRRFVDTETKKKVSSAIQSKKKAAQESAQMVASNGFNAPSNEQQARELLKGGDMKSALFKFLGR
jgi:hypothetical protein